MPGLWGRKGKQARPGVIVTLVNDRNLGALKLHLVRNKNIDCTKQFLQAFTSKYVAYMPIRTQYSGAI